MGMATGAAMGSVVPIVGTIIGGLLGGALGSLLGGGNDKKKAQRKAERAAEAAAQAQAAASLAEFNAQFNRLSSLVPDGVRHVVAMGAAITSVGAAMPETREQFQALVNAQDLSTASGRALAGSLMQMSGSMEAFFDAIEQNKKVFDLQFKGVGETGLTGQISLLRQAVAETMRSIPRTGPGYLVPYYEVPASRAEYVRRTEHMDAQNRRLGSYEGGWSRERYAALLASAELMDQYFDAIEAQAAVRKASVRGLKDLFRTPAEIAAADAAVGGVEPEVQRGGHAPARSSSIASP
jgi:pyruvate/2-oxoglutarate dehydrogenase complex dihydrolipoamide acyltransferase (E2) component